MAEENNKPKDEEKVVVEEKVKETEEVVAPVEEKKSKPAVEKKSRKKEEVKIELEREYVIPLRKEVLKTVGYKKAKRAVKTIKEFLAIHMRVEDRDLKKVKINIHLNNEVWFRGIKKPMSKIKVKAIKKDGIVYAELADVPQVVQFKIDRENRKAIEASSNKVKTPKHDKEKPLESDKDNDGIEDKIEEKEDKKSVIEKGLKEQKADAKTIKHTSKGSHAKKTAPVRKVLK